MFTGIISHLGKVESLKIDQKKDLLLQISVPINHINYQLKIGCSIACNGICLTLIEEKIFDQNIIFSFQASKETCIKTTLDKWQIGQIINIEFALKMGDEFGGHIVSGHVDNTAEVVSIKCINQSYEFYFRSEKKLLKFIAEKGSVTIDGVSLTVNEVRSDSFSVNVIPHTLKNTAFQNLEISNLVNLEIDLIARYISRIIKNNDD